MIGVALAFLAGDGRAQTLDFDGAGVFREGSEKLAPRLAATLREEAKSLETKSESVSGAEVERLQSQARVRHLAAALLDAGSLFAEGGSVHSLIGRRMASRRAEMDAEITNLATHDEGRQGLVAFLNASPADATLIPPDVADLDRLLAQTFAPLLAATGRGAARSWPIVRLDPAAGDPAAFDAVLDECAKVAGVTEEAAGVLRALGADLREVEGTGRGQQAGAERQLVTQASAAVLRAPRWLTPKGTATLASVFDEAGRNIGERQSRHSARTDMARLALVADILGRIDRARLTTRQARQMRGLGVALAEQLSPGAGDCDDAITALRRGLVLLDEYETARWDDNRRIVREVRPLWREAEAQARRIRDELIEALSRISPTAPALSDPGVLSGLAAMRERLDDARRLCVISAWLAGAADPGAAGVRIWTAPAAKPGERPQEPLTERDSKLKRQAGLRLLALGRWARDVTTHEPTMACMRALADGLDAWAPVRGEDDLRAGAAAPDSPLGVRWREATGGGADDLARALEAARQAWLQTWSEQQERPAAEDQRINSTSQPDRVDQFRELIEIAGDTVLIMDLAEGPGVSGIAAWPGFEISGESLRLFCAPIQSELARATGMVIAGNFDDMERLLVGIRGPAKIARTIAELQRRALASNLSGAGPLDELATPPVSLPTLGEDLTPATWLLDVREPIASLCRGIEEHVAATTAGERERALALTRFMVAEADRILRSLE